MSSDYPLGLALLAYGGGLFWSLWQLSRGKFKPAGPGILTGIAMSAQLLDLLMRADAGARPWQSLSGALLMASLFAAVMLLSLRTFLNIQALDAFGPALPFALLVMGAFIRQGGPESTPGPSGPWSLVHVPFAALGLAVLGISALAVGAYKLKGGLLKAKKFGGFGALLPSLERLDKIILTGAVIGFFCLTFGLITGAMWASHGEMLGAWRWTLKEFAALLAWGVYAVYLYVRLVAKWQRPATSMLLLVGFTLVLVIFATEAWRYS